MALSDINLEEITPRTTLTRTDLALLRNATAHLDNSVEFGDLIKQIFALVQQSDLTGSSFETLADSNLTVKEAHQSEQVIKESIGRYSDDDLMLLKNNITFIQRGLSGGNLGAYATSLDIYVKFDFWENYILYINGKPFDGSLTTALKSDSGGNSWYVDFGSSNDIDIYSTHYWGADSSLWMCGNSWTMSTPTNSIFWVQYNNISSWPICVEDNKRTPGWSTTVLTDRGFMLGPSPYYRDLTHVGLYVRYGYAPSTIISLSIETDGDIGHPDCVAYSPTLDKWVFSAKDGDGVKLTEQLASPYFTANVSTELHAESVNWCLDSFVTAYGDNVIKKTTDLSTWTSHTLPTGAEANAVQQLGKVNNEASTSLWHIVLCNNGWVYFTKDFTTFYPRRVGFSDWVSMSMINANSGMIMSKDLNVAIFDLQ